MQNRGRKNNGFILLESIIAMMIISITLSTGILLIWLAQDMQKSLPLIMHAELLGENLLTSIKKQSFETLHSFSEDDENYHLNVAVNYRSPLIAEVTATISSVQHQFNPVIVTDTFVDLNHSENNSCAFLSDKLQITLEKSDQIQINASSTVTDSLISNNLLYISADSANSNNPDLYIVDVHDEVHPKIISSLNTGPGIAAIAIHYPYLFVANKGTNEFQIIDVQKSTMPFLVAQAHLPGVTTSNGGGIGQSIFYYEGFVYVGLTKSQGPELHQINVQDPQTPIVQNTFEVGSEVSVIVAQGNTVFAGAPQEKQIFAIDRDTFLEQKYISISGWQTQVPNAIKSVGEELYIGRTVGGFNTKNEELFLFDMSKTSPQQIDHQEIGASVDDITVVGNTVFITTSDINKEFQIYSRNPFSFVNAVDLTSRALKMLCKNQTVFITMSDPNSVVQVLHSE